MLLKRYHIVIIGNHIRSRSSMLFKVSQGRQETRSSRLKYSVNKFFFCCDFVNIIRKQKIENRCQNPPARKSDPPSPKSAICHYLPATSLNSIIHLQILVVESRQNVVVSNMEMSIQIFGFFIRDTPFVLKLGVQMTNTMPAGKHSESAEGWYLGPNGLDASDLNSDFLLRISEKTTVLLVE